MFSNNDKISSRQIKRLLIFEIFGAGSLLLPSRLAQAGTETGLWCIPAGAGMACVYLWILHACFSRARQDYLQYLKQGWGSFAAKFFYICYAFISLLTCAWAAELLARLMCKNLLDNKQFPTALLMILLLALYGGIAGLEARARIYEIMFWVLVIPLALMLLLCVRQVQAVQWFPLYGQADGESFGRFWDGALRCFASFLPLTFLLFLLPHVQEKEKKKAGRTAFTALLVCGAAFLAVYLILLGIFGSAALAQEEYPVITLMGMVKLPGDFIKRLDTVMSGVWFFTLYALIGTTLYYSVMILRRACGGTEPQEKAEEKTDQARRYGWFLAAAAAVYAMAYVLRTFPQAEVLLERLFYAGAVPFLVCVPAVSVFLCGIRLQEKKEEKEDKKDGTKSR